MSQQSLTNVFTYGSLMYPQVIGKLVKNTYLSEKALLRDFERRQVKNVAYPGVKRCPGKQVAGVIYYGVNKADLQALDYFESDEYQKVDVVVQTSDGKKVNGVVYCYLNLANLQNYDWKIENFEKQHKHTFADSHVEYKQKKQQF